MRIASLSRSHSDTVMATSRLVALCVAAFAHARAIDVDLVWRDDPGAWHQQTARIIDHRFTTFDTMAQFAMNAKKAGVSVLMLVQIQKTSACPGLWYNGLQLCDHVNGSYPAADGSLSDFDRGGGPAFISKESSTGSSTSFS